MSQFNAPRDNCLIIIDKRCRDVKDAGSNLLALQHNINLIQKNVSEFVLILISDDEITFQQQMFTTNRSSVKVYKVEPLEDIEMKMYL